MTKFKLFHNIDNKTVTITFRANFFRTDSPADAHIALDLRYMLFSAELSADDYNADPQRYALYAPEEDELKQRIKKYAAMFADNINEQGVCDLMRRGVVTMGYVVAEVVLTLPEDFYADYAADNDLPPLEQITKEAAE